MITWTDHELQQVAAAEELQLASKRPDGSLRPYVTMWVVGVDGDLYVRSAGGPDRGWYRRAIASAKGRIRAGGIEADVTFVVGTDVPNAVIDAAYHAKYDRYGARLVSSVVGADAHEVTIRLLPSGR